MFCPHCHNKIPDGSNICPLCYSNLAGLKIQTKPASGAQDDAAERKAAPKKSSKKKAQAYTKGSRGSKKSADRTPMIIAFGLIMILVIIIAMIVRSMFGIGTAPVATPTPPIQQAQNTPQGNFIVFGATSTPAPQQIVTPTPVLEITPSPTPVAEHSYHTLRKGDQGPDVVTMQQALAELGYLNGAADGNFGTGTQTAVKSFQKDRGLDADGIAGRMTLEALYSESSVTPLPDNTPTAAPGDILDLPG